MKKCINNLQQRCKKIETPNMETNFVDSTDFFSPNKNLIPDKFKYKMNHKERGVALVIYHHSFEVPGVHLEKREKHRKDFKKVAVCFHKLGFQVRKCQDKKLKEILKILEKLRLEDHSERDCLAIIVLTHGDKNILFAKDAGYKYDLLWNPFSSENCKSLQGKPRLYFIQACRGKSLDGGIKLVHIDNLPSKVYNLAVEEREYSHEECNTTSKPQGADSEGTQEDQYLPVLEEDFLVTFASVPGHQAWKRLGVYAWFIEKLSEVLSSPEDVEKYHILNLLTLVNGQVAFEFESKNDGYKQVSCVYSNLKKFLYF